MENGGLSASDVALLNGNDGFAGGGSFMWIFGLLILMGMMNGGFGGWGNGGGYDRWATQSDVQYTSQFAQLLDGNRDIMAQANNNTNNIVQSVTNAEYETVAAMKDAQLQLQDRLSGINVGQAQILANQNECCCNTRLELANQSALTNQNIMQNRYEAAMNTAAINANTTEQTQRILDAITGNRMADMQNQINELQLRSQLADVVRYPNQFTYSAGNNPFCGGAGCMGNM